MTGVAGWVPLTCGAPACAACIDDVRSEDAVHAGKVCYDVKQRGKETYRPLNAVGHAQRSHQRERRKGRSLAKIVGLIRGFDDFDTAPTAVQGRYCLYAFGVKLTTSVVTVLATMLSR